jgi:TolB-like protein/Flp pilus assembly protein TadD
MQLRVFLSELQRRQVYRVIIVYATIAWVLLEGADIVFPRLGFADESVTLVLILVGIGFPIALYLAWVFDITPEGIFRTPPLSPGTKHHFSWGRIVEFLLFGGLIVAVGYLYLDRLSLQQQILEEPTTPDNSEIEVPDPARYRSIAVLPFADMSETGDQAWFAEGIAEELLLALSKVEPLSVVARTSSFAFRDTDKTIAEIAELLGVQAVLEGSVRRSGDRVRITAQFIDASSGYHIWSGSYQRDLDDIFAIQDELARGIVDALRIELGVDSFEPLILEQTGSTKAYNWFIRGRALFDWDSPQNLYQSISYFENAVQEDADYALAWGYLAMGRSLTVLWQPTEEVSPATIMAYERALELDPDQSEALTAKAWMTLLLHRDWEAAEKLYQRAMAPRENTVATSNYAMFYLAPTDRISHAIRLYRNVENLDPLHAGIKANLAYLLLWQDDPKAAMQKAREALELNPLHFFGITVMAEAYRMAGQCPAAVEFLQSLPEAMNKTSRIRTLAALCHASQDDYNTARKIYRDVVENTQRYIDTSLPAQLALSLGELEVAVDLMERAVESKAYTQFMTRVRFREHEALENHPRFLALLKRIGLDDESVAAMNSQYPSD